MSTGQPRAGSRPRAERTERRRSNAERVLGGVLGAGAGLTVGGSELLAAAAGGDGGAAGGGGSSDGGSGDAGSGGDSDEGSAVRRTVSDIVEVVPEPVKMLLVALAVLAAALGGGYLLLAERGRRLARQRADLLQEVGLLQTALLPPVPATVGRRAHLGCLSALGRPRRRRRLLRRADPSGRPRGVHPRRRVGPRPPGARPHRVHALHAARLPRGRARAAHRAAGGRAASSTSTWPATSRPWSWPCTIRASGSLTYACAGHPAPIVVGATQPRAGARGIVAAHRPGAAHRPAPDHAAASGRLGRVPVHGRPGRGPHRAQHPRAAAPGRHRRRARPRRHGGRTCSTASHARPGWSPTTWPPWCSRPTPA